MAWQFVSDGVGKEWAVDPDQMYALVRANVRAVEIRKRMKVEVERHIIGPDLTNVEIDYNGLRGAVDTGAKDWWEETRLRLMNLSGERVLEDLTMLRAEERTKTAEVEEAQRKAQLATSAAITASVDRGEFGLAAATLIRDLSAATLIVGASIITGGAAAAAAGGAATAGAAGAGTVTAWGATFTASGAASSVLAAGSMLKGVSKFQDTGNVGSAIVEGSSQFILGACGMAGESMKQGGNILLVLSSTIDSLAEGGKAIMEGQSTNTAAKLAAARFGMAIASGKLPFAKFGGWEKIRAAVSGGVSVGADKIVGLAGPQLPKTPDANKVSWIPARGDDDLTFVKQKVLRPAR